MKDHVSNRGVVDRFHKQFGMPGTYERCYYDPTDIQWGAVAHVFRPGMGVFHAVFWPCMALVTGSLACGIFCNRCRALEARKEMKDNSSSASTTAFLVEKPPPIKQETKAKAKGKAKAKMKNKEKGLDEEKKKILINAKTRPEEGAVVLSPPLRKKANWLW